MGSIVEGSFSAPSQTISMKGLLFDFDGTIIDSTAAIVKHWHKQGNLMGVDPELILASSHGRRSIDVFDMYDRSKANWDYVNEQEGLIPIHFGNDAEEIPGARKVLERLDALNAPWAVVTSGTRPLITGWIKVLKLAQPRTMVVAEDVAKGKPDPEPYLLGRKRLGLSDDTECIVFEDAPAGIRAGKAAGFRVVAFATTHTIAQLKEAGADWILRDLNSLSIDSYQDGLVRFAIKDAFEPL